MEIGISKNNREKVCAVLQEILANYHIFYIKIRNFHWNVVDENFIVLHRLFAEFYTALETDIDDIAERIRQLGDFPAGSMKEFLELSSDISEINKNTRLKAGEMVDILLSDFEKTIVKLRKAIGTCHEASDEGTADFLVELIRKSEKVAWFLRSSQKK